MFSGLSCGKPARQPRGTKMQHKVGVRTDIIVVNPGSPRHVSAPYITVYHTVVMAKLDSGE